MKKNSTSYLRWGFDYQDLWVLRLCSEWLLNPSLYKWVKIESSPVDWSFFLDDVLLLGENNKYHFFQAKFKADSNFMWSWGDLLEKRKSRKEGKFLPSLLNKWSNSIKNVGVENINQASFVTNGDLSDDIKKYLSENLIDISKLKTNTDLYERIKLEFESEDDLLDFFNVFYFISENNEKSLIEDNIRTVYYEDLLATKSWVDSLLLFLKWEAEKEYTKQITIDKIKEQCEFDILEPLNESFEVPNDFQFFDKNSHKNLLEDLKNCKWWLKVISGKPWVGKSVYLSQLSKVLKDLDIVIIKHHYHINPSDSNINDRVNSERVIKAIKAQFKQSKYKWYLGDLSNKNLWNIVLKDFIKKVSNSLLAEKKSLVLIIDGLDHVVREKDINELKVFLDEIFYPQEWLWVILWTQPQIKKEPSLNSIFSKCTGKNEIEVKGLSLKAISNLINKNEIWLKLPEDNRQLRELYEKIFEITQGNPLHLRYILQQLKKENQNNLVTDYSCNKLIPYNNDIKNYYENLWKSLDISVRTFLLIFVSIDFNFTYKQFIECVSSFENSLEQTISEKFNKVDHLIFKDTRDKLRIFHDSFHIFLLHQSEWTDQEQSIKIKIKEWLEQSKYENLKWSELRKLECRLWNKKPILEINRDWLINSICYPRNYSQIKSQLDLAWSVAIKEKNFFLALQSYHLNIYNQNVQDFVEHPLELIWIEAIYSNTDYIDDLIIYELPSTVLVEVAIIAESFGKNYIINEIIDVLRDRLGYQEYRKNEIPEAARALIKVIPYDRKHKVEKVYSFMKQFRDLGITSHLFSLYSKQLLLLGQTTKIQELLKSDLEWNEKDTILKNCIELDYIESKENFKNLIINEKQLSITSEVYLYIISWISPTLRELPEIKDFPSTIKEYGDDRNIWIKKFYDFFQIALSFWLSWKEQALMDWIQTSNVEDKWPIKATTKLFTIAINISKTIKTDKDIYYKDIFLELVDLEDLTWSDNRDQIEFKYAFVKMIGKLLREVIFFKSYFWKSLKIDKLNYQTILSTPFFIQKDLFDLSIDIGFSILDVETFQIICNEKEKSLSENINEFPDRAEEYVNISKLDRLYNNKNHSKKMLVKASDNLLGYGYHKDVYLFYVLESLDYCAQKGIDTNSWINRLIPIIYNINDCTDWDETHNLPAYLSDFLSKYNKELLFKYYFSEADKEELYPSQEIFQYIIKSINLSNDNEIYLASTAIDDKSYNELKNKNSIWSKKALKIIEDSFWKIQYKDDSAEKKYDYSDNEKDYSIINPENIKKHLNTLGSKWDIEKYIIWWIKYWLNEWNKENIYGIIKDISFENVSIDLVSWEMLDILYPLAYEFDNDKAFEYLCFAQKNGHGWEPYWRSKDKTINRWNFLKQKFPNRYLEFFEKSRENSFPLSYGVDFFLFFDDKDRAIEITESWVCFVEKLMADIKLTSPDWLNESFSSKDEIDILLQRLTWASSLVREKAAVAIAHLLNVSSERELIFKRLLSWLNSWNIETIVAIGLLPIIKAFHINDNWYLKFIKIDEICKSIKVNSIVIEELLITISEYTNEEIKSLPNYLLIVEYPKDYEISEFFEKNINGILPPIYLDRAQEIQKKTGIDFMKLWSYNSEKTAKINDIEISSNRNFYGHSKGGKFLIWFATKVSEVYRSVFLRLMEDIKLFMPQDYYVEYSFSTLPVDISFWKISSNKMPKYWPKIIKDDNVVIDIKNEPISLLEVKKDNYILLWAKWAICPKEWWIKSPKQSFSFIWFGYKIIWKNIPTEKEFWEIFFKNTTSSLLIPTKANKPIAFLENNIFFDIWDEPIQIKDILVYPLLTNNKTLTVNFWQYFKDKNQSFNVIDFLRKDLKVEISNDRWSYINKDKEEKIIFKDWIEWLQERYEFDMPTPYGQEVLVDSDFINKKLKENWLKLWYVNKSTYRKQEHTYSDIEKTTKFQLFWVW